MGRILAVCLLSCSLVFSVAGCTNTQKGVVGGSALGAAAGLGIAAVSGGYLGWGALAGAGVGALAGGIVGKQKDDYEDEEYYRRHHHHSRYDD
ncbi:MAG: cell envelope biogenesis protein OmpA [Desulfovibrio sp.]|nr:cell envelope biogenesis protein OmpA [Desulfovibrio sp.]